MTPYIPYPRRVRGPLCARLSTARRSPRTPPRCQNQVRAGDRPYILERRRKYRRTTRSRTSLRVAKYAEGKWSYGRQTRSRRTNETKLVWKNAEHYTPAELDSDEFQQMRRTAEPYFAKHAAYVETDATPSTRTLDTAPEDPEPPPLAEGTRVVKFVFTAADGQIFSRIRADSSNDPGGPHIDLSGGKVDPNETLLQAAHRELKEELSPYGLDLRNRVEAALSAAPNGHSQARMKLSDNCNGHYQIMVWGIQTSRTEPLRGWAR